MPYFCDFRDYTLNINSTMTHIPVNAMTLLMIDVSADETEVEN